MLYYLYNDYRESILFDINSKLRSDAVKCNKVKLTNISTFNLDNIKNDDVLIITGCAIPSTIHNFKTDSINSYETFLSTFNKKIILFEDIHKYTYGNYNNLFNDLKKYNIKYGVSMYDCIEWTFIKQNYNWDKTFILIQHYNSNVFKNKNLKKDIDVLLYGDVIRIHYPLRHRIVNILKKTNKFNVKIKNRAGYFTKNMDSVIAHRNELSNLINRSHICIATCSKYEYFVCKYLEITGANSVCAGNMESIGKLFFENNYIELNLDMSDEEIENKLLDSLKDKMKLEEMNKNVFKKIQNFSIENHYWDHLCDLVNTL